MLATALLLAADLASVAKPGLAAISSQAISAHVRFLADDVLEGRGTGSRGHAIAARYVATQLQGMGFAPAAEKGSISRLCRCSARRSSPTRVRSSSTVTRSRLVKTG